MNKLLKVLLVLSVASVIKAEENNFDEDAFSKELMPLEDVEELFDTEVTHFVSKISFGVS